MKRTAAALAAIGMALGTAGMSHADDRSYIDALRNGGASMSWPFSENNWIEFGDSICRTLRGGRDINTVEFGIGGIWRDLTINSAQSELCPDTIGDPT